MRRIIEQAGCKSWEKLFVNLRASRRTELQQAFPWHVVDAWLGRIAQLAERHYLMVTTDHWEKGATQAAGEMARLSEENRRGNAGGNISAHQPASVGSKKRKSPVKSAD
jgi:hypothetical protein